MKKLLLLLCLLCFACADVHVEWELLSITREASIAGSFALGCGSFGSELYYVGYVRQKGDDKIWLKSFCADRTAIVEDAKNGYAYIEFDDTAPTTDIENTHPTYYSTKLCYNHGQMTLHVPKGTVLRQFQLE